MKAQARTPGKGMVWSPLTSYPRNAPCHCESGNKHKHCHGPKQSPFATTTMENAMKFKRDFPEYYKQGRMI